MKELCRNFVICNTAFRQAKNRNLSRPPITKGKVQNLFIFLFSYAAFVHTHMLPNTVLCGMHSLHFIEIMIIVQSGLLHSVPNFTVSESPLHLFMWFQFIISTAFIIFAFHQWVLQQGDLFLFLLYAHMNFHQKLEVGIEESMPLAYFLITHARAACQKS